MCHQIDSSAVISYVNLAAVAFNKDRYQLAEWSARQAHWPSADELRAGTRKVIVHGVGPASFQGVCSRSVGQQYLPFVNGRVLVE